MAAMTCNSSAKLTFLVLLITLCVSWPTIEAQEPKTANFEFYMHDIVDGPDQTALLVAPANASVGTFSSVSVIDNPLTATADRRSTLIGRAQGIYVASSQRDVSLLMSITVFMVSGPYNGSTFSVIGRNPVMQDVREMPIVGGSGMFRLARGYCFAQTQTLTGSDAVVKYNVTVLLQ